MLYNRTDAPQATPVHLENKVCFENYESVRKLLLSLLTPQLNH